MPKKRSISPLRFLTTSGNEACRRVIDDRIQPVTASSS
jgi:hypothetical protein